MLRNRRLARAISDAGWAEFARLLGYKQTWRGGTLVVAAVGFRQASCTWPAVPSVAI
jgi:hypothetical protein